MVSNASTPPARAHTIYYTKFIYKNSGKCGKHHGSASVLHVAFTNYLVKYQSSRQWLNLKDLNPKKNCKCYLFHRINYILKSNKITLHNFIDKRQRQSQLHTQIQTNQELPCKYLHYYYTTNLRKCLMLCNVAGEEIYWKVFRKRLFSFIMNQDRKH